MGGVTIDLTAVAAIWIGGVLVLIPLTALLLRYGVIPLLEAVTEYRRHRADKSGELDRRMRVLEERLRKLESRQASEGRGIGVA
ncbi:MAG: hypothetical protein GEU90_17515 [Gemmatimonas sp.]|nr:hypothetical protein [Gemmatimonas sp.]